MAAPRCGDTAHEQVVATWCFSVDLGEAAAVTRAVLPSLTSVVLPSLTGVSDGLLFTWVVHSPPRAVTTAVLPGLAGVSDGLLFTWVVHSPPRADTTSKARMGRAFTA